MQEETLDYLGVNVSDGGAVVFGFWE